MKRNTIIVALLTAGVGLAGVTAVAAQGPSDRSGERSGARFDRLDANGDSELTLEEMTAKQAAIIEEADTDGNGALSKAEMRAFREAKRAERNPDKNDDGVIDRTEFINAAQDRFDRLDRNGDGVLSEDERPGKKGRRGRR